MNGIVHVALIRFIDLFTVSHGGNWNQQWGCVTLMWIAALCDIGTLTWLSGTLMLAFKTLFFFCKRSSIVLSRRFML